jgi:hypothetical protein
MSLTNTKGAPLWPFGNSRMTRAIHTTLRCLIKTRMMTTTMTTRLRSTLTRKTSNG